MAILVQKLGESFWKSNRVRSCFFPCCGVSWRDFGGPLGMLAESYHFADLHGLPCDCDLRQLASRITFHRCDAVEALRRLPSISMFFYTGDCGGEGSSSLCWWGERLFALVMEKLEPSGFVVTDGSAGDSYFYTEADKAQMLENAPIWSCSNRREVIVRQCEVRSRFDQRSFRFNLVGALPKAFGPKDTRGQVLVWQKI